MNNDNLKEIAQAIFSKPVGEPNSIQLQLDEETYQENNKTVIYEILYLITYYGIKILYGDINIIDLTEDQFDNIKKYVRSYGYNLIIFDNDNKGKGYTVNKVNIYFEALR
jgi:hypothetical protein